MQRGVGQRTTWSDSTNQAQLGMAGVRSSASLSRSLLCCLSSVARPLSSRSAHHHYHDRHHLCE